MSTWYPTKKIAISKLKLPGDIRARQKKPHVERRAGSIKRIGLISLPVVNAETMELIAGRDRIAALLANGTKAVEVRLFSGTADELREVELAENIERRNDDQDVKEYVDLVEKRLKAEREAAGGQDISGQADQKSSGPGRKKTTRGEAREEVAAALNKSPEAVRAHEKRAEAKAAPNNEFLPPEPDGPPPPPVDTFGLPLLADGESEELCAIQDACTSADSFLRRASAALAPIQGTKLGGALYQVLVRLVHDAGAEIRRARPTSVCPFCKRIPSRVSTCAACHHRIPGFVGTDGLLGVAEELRLGGEQAMVPDGAGGMVPYTRAAKAPAAPAAGPKRPAPDGKKRMTVVLPDGSAHDPADLDGKGGEW